MARPCGSSTCGEGGILCPMCLLENSEAESAAAAEHPSPNIRQFMAWMRGEPGAEPPPGCQWGPPQRVPAGAEVVPDTPPTAEDWAAIYDETLELETRRVEVQRAQEQVAADQGFLGDSWARYQADREALEAREVELRNRAHALTAWTGFLGLWTIQLLQLRGAPGIAVFLLTLVLFSVLAWKFWGEAWVQGKPSVFAFARHSLYLLRREGPKR